MDIAVNINPMTGIPWASARTDDVATDSYPYSDLDAAAFSDYTSDNELSSTSFVGESQPCSPIPSRPTLSCIQKAPVLHPQRSSSPPSSETLPALTTSSHNSSSSSKDSLPAHSLLTPQTAAIHLHSDPTVDSPSRRSRDSVNEPERLDRGGWFAEMQDEYLASPIPVHQQTDRNWTFGKPPPLPPPTATELELERLFMGTPNLNGGPNEAQFHSSLEADIAVLPSTEKVTEEGSGSEAAEDVFSARGIPATPLSAVGQRLALEASPDISLLTLKAEPIDLILSAHASPSRSDDCYANTNMSQQQITVISPADLIKPRGSSYGVQKPTLGPHNQRRPTGLTIVIPPISSISQQQLDNTAATNALMGQMSDTMPGSGVASHYSSMQSPYGDLGSPSYPYTPSTTPAGAQISLADLPILASGSSARTTPNNGLSNITVSTTSRRASRANSASGRRKISDAASSSNSDLRRGRFSREGAWSRKPTMGVKSSTQDTMPSTPTGTGPGAGTRHKPDTVPSSPIKDSMNASDSLELTHSLIHDAVAQLQDPLFVGHMGRSTSASFVEGRLATPGTSYALLPSLNSLPPPPTSNQFNLGTNVFQPPTSIEQSVLFGQIPMIALTPTEERGQEQMFLVHRQGSSPQDNHGIMLSADDLHLLSEPDSFQQQQQRMQQQQQVFGRMNPNGVDEWSMPSSTMARSEMEDVNWNSFAPMQGATTSNTSWMSPAFPMLPSRSIIQHPPTHIPTLSHLASGGGMEGTSLSQAQPTLWERRRRFSSIDMAPMTAPMYGSLMLPPHVHIPDSVGSGLNPLGGVGMGGIGGAMTAPLFSYPLSVQQETPSWISPHPVRFSETMEHGASSGFTTPSMYTPTTGIGGHAGMYAQSMPTTPCMIPPTFGNILQQQQQQPHHRFDTSASMIATPTAPMNTNPSPSARRGRQRYGLPLAPLSKRTTKRAETHPGAMKTNLGRSSTAGSSPSTPCTPSRAVSSPSKLARLPHLASSPTASSTSVVAPSTHSHTSSTSSTTSGLASPTKSSSTGTGKSGGARPSGSSMFVNFTSRDAVKLLTGVAPSGSSKRKRDESSEESKKDGKKRVVTV